MGKRKGMARTAILVGDNLSLIVDSAGDGAVGVARGDTDDGALAGRNADLGLAHFCRGCEGVG